MEMRQQGHKSAEITIRQGPDRAGSVTAGNMLQVISHQSLAHATAVPWWRTLGPFCGAALPGFALVRGNPWG